ncbi:MAG: CNNM domain-containing protein [Psittacicella sp.]
MEVTILIIILILLILGSSFFSSSETGIISLNKLRLKKLSKEGNIGAQNSEKLLKHIDIFLTLVLFYNNIINIAASALATLIGISLFGKLGVLISTVILSFLILIFGDIVPKTFAAKYPERISFPASRILLPLRLISWPLIHSTLFVSKSILKLFNIQNDEIKRYLNVEELKIAVDEASNNISNSHKNMLISLLDLGNITVDDIMIPRNEIYAIDINLDLEEILLLMNKTMHNKIVLYRDILDRTIGYISIKEVYKMISTNSEFTKDDILKLAYSFYYTPEGTPLNSQLLSFKKNKEELALIVDEYGDLKGLITLKDILEEIVGDFTNSLPSIITDIKSDTDGNIIANGSSNLRELNKVFNINLNTDQAHTLNGLILEYLGTIPKAGDKCKIDGIDIEVLKIENYTIKQVKLALNMSHLNNFKLN